MGDYGESDEARANRQAQQRREWEAANTEHAKAQRALDWAWELKLARDAEAAYRRRAPDEKPWCGEYNPVARFERENGRR